MSNRFFNRVSFLVSSVFFAVFCDTPCPRAQAAQDQPPDLSQVLEANTTGAWRDYLIKQKPTREESDYRSLLSTSPDRLVVVPLEPDFALTAQQILEEAAGPTPRPSRRGEEILFVSYSFKYGAPMWWMSRFSYGRPDRPPAEFGLEMRLKLHLLNTRDGSLASYPEQSHAGNTNNRDGSLNDLLTKVTGALAGAPPSLRDMVKTACEETVRVGQIVDGKEGGLDRELRRRIARLEIKDKDSRLRQRGAEALAAIADTSDLDILTGLLVDSDSDVRGAVVVALNDATMPEALRARLTSLFGKALLDDSSFVRAQAAAGLGKTKSPDALEPLLAAANDQAVHVRSAAVESLGQLGNPRATETLIRLLDDEEGGWPVAADKAAAASLDKLGWKPPDMALQVKYLLASRKADDLAALGKPAVPPLINALLSKNDDRVRIAVTALGKIGDPQATEPLLALLAAPGRISPSLVTEALGEIGDRRALTPLIACLKEADMSTRLAALKALGSIGDNRAAKPVAEFLNDPDKGIRGAAAEALKKFNWQPEDPRGKVQVALMLGDRDRLLKMGKTAVPPLVAMLLDKDESTRLEAIGALGNLGSDAEEAVVPLCSRLTSESEKEVIAVLKALGSIGDDRAAKPVAELLKHRDLNVRKAAAEALKRLDWQPEQPQGKVQVALILGDGDTLLKMGKTAVPPLVAILLDKDESTRFDAIGALGNLGSDAEEAVVPLCSRLTSESEAEVIAALQALARIGQTSASAAIEKALAPRKQADKASLWMHYALAQLGAQKGIHVAALIDALSFDLGDTAAEVIAEIDLNREEVELLFKVLSHSDAKARERAAGVLGGIGGTTVTNALWKRLAEEKDNHVREALRKALGEAYQAGQKREK